MLSKKLEVKWLSYSDRLVMVNVPVLQIPDVILFYQLLVLNYTIARVWWRGVERAGVSNP